MYVVAPITTEPTLMAVSSIGATPATSSGSAWLKPRASARNAAYVGALSSTADSAPADQNSCHGSRSKSPGAAAARLKMMKEQPLVDFVFVDNAQTFDTLRTEWEAWSTVVAPGGVICLHDSRHWPEDSPAQSSVEYTRSVVLQDSRFTTIEEADSLTVLRRLPG